LRGAINFLAGIINRACPTTSTSMTEALEETMNPLKKIVVWGLAFCAVAISPVILIYGVLFGIGIVSDLVQIVADQAPLCVVSAVWVGWVGYTFAKMSAI